jgi:serine/threonine protein phosphatase 1
MYLLNHSNADIDKERLRSASIFWKISCNKDNNMHIKTLTHPSGGRLFVMGELYGHFPALRHWMQGVSFKTSVDKIVLLGNFLGYAASSRQAHHYLSLPWVHAVLGENEVAVLARLDDTTDAPCRSLVGQWIAGMAPPERALLQRSLQNLPIALELHSEDGLTVLSNRPLAEDSPWDTLKAKIAQASSRREALGVFMSRLGTLRCLGQMPGAAMRPAVGVSWSLSAFSLEAPRRSHLKKHNRIILTGSTSTAQGPEYNHASLLPSLEINDFSLSQVKLCETLLDVRPALYPTMNWNTSMH